jgi:hypothetical protein
VIFGTSGWILALFGGRKALAEEMVTEVLADENATADATEARVASADGQPPR